MADMALKLMVVNSYPVKQEKKIVRTSLFLSTVDGQPSGNFFAKEGWTHADIYHRQEMTVVII